MRFLKNLQRKPEKVRNRIFWTALIVSLGIIGFFWIKSLGHTLFRLKIESGEIGKSSENFFGAKEESPIFQLKEAINQFKEFLENDEVKNFLKNQKEEIQK